MGTYSWPGTVRELENFIRRLVVWETPLGRIGASDSDPRDHTRLFADTEPRGTCFRGDSAARTGS